jgi:acetylornithine deacetylase/succinyl-diaminopimelate desuccinylase-like protein
VCVCVLQDNVIPAEASALVNHRVHPGQSVAEVVERDRKSISDDRVKVVIASQMEAHKVSPFGPADLAYQLLATSVRQSFEQVVVAPCESPHPSASNPLSVISADVAASRFSPLVVRIAN